MLIWPFIPLNFYRSDLGSCLSPPDTEPVKRWNEAVGRCLLRCFISPRGDCGGSSRSYRVLCSWKTRLLSGSLACLSFHKVCHSRSIYSMASQLIISSMALIELLIKCEGALQIHSKSQRSDLHLRLQTTVSSNLPNIPVITSPIVKLIKLLSVTEMLI